MTRFFIYVSILAGTSVISFGLAGIGYSIPAVGAGLCGLVWMIACWRGFQRFASPAFAVFTVISIVSIWAGVSSWLALACVTFSLIAWDLAMFVRRLGLAGDPQDRVRMERAHFARLGSVAGLGVIGAAAAARIHIDLTFGSSALLALLAFWGISALIYSLRSRE